MVGNCPIDWSKKTCCFILGKGEVQDGVKEEMAFGRAVEHRYLEFGLGPALP